MILSGMNEKAFRDPVGQAGWSVLLVAGAVSALWFMIPRLSLAWISDASPPQSSVAAAQALESKIRLLFEPESGGPKSFQPIVVTEDEVNAYLKYHRPNFLPLGVHDPALHITPERIFGSAQIDFGELSRTPGNPADWRRKVLAAMFKAPQRVGVSVRMETQNGQAKVKIESVVVGTTSVPNWLVDFLLENCLPPRFKFDLSKPIALPDHVTRVEWGRGKATLVRSPDKKTGLRIHEPGLRMQPTEGGGQ
jgi:hypothetical protein